MDSFTVIKDYKASMVGHTITILVGFNFKTEANTLLKQLVMDTHRASFKEEVQ